MRPVLRAPRSSRRAASAAIAALLAAVAVGCAPQPEEDASGSASASASASGASCAKGELGTKTSGKLTIATDQPAYEPWFKDDDPKNGEGFESAVAYAVAKQLGYDKADVVWQSVPFNKAFAPVRRPSTSTSTRCRSATSARRPWTSRRATTTCVRPSSR